MPSQIFNREREVSFALVGKVDQELKQLERSGIISNTKISDWVSPLVVISRAEGGIRLCVDYKARV